MNHRRSSAAFRWESALCGLYFMGQNLFYLLIYMYINTYFTDIGIPVLAVGCIALLVRMVDVLIGPLFYQLFYRVQTRHNLMRMLRLSVLLLPICTVILFSISADAAPAPKIRWAVSAYLIWTVLYGISSTPPFCVDRAVTETYQGRTVLGSVGRLCAMAAALILLVLIPCFRITLGGWASVAALLSIVGILPMLPSCFEKSEHFSFPEAQTPISLRQIFSTLRQNHYLLVFFWALMLTGSMNISSCWGLYLARHCLRNEALFSVSGILSMLPFVLFGAFLPIVIRRTDKLRLYYYAAGAYVIMQLIRYLVGYENLTLYLLSMALSAVPTAITTSILFCFTHDCVEYGRYMGLSISPALSHATEVFLIKLQSAGAAVLSCIVLAVIGLAEGEGALQTPNFSNRLWTASIIIPAIGMLMGLMVLRRYDLRDHDVALMQMYNDGQISREEASRQLCRIYKPV